MVAVDGGMTQRGLGHVILGRCLLACYSSV